MQIEIKTHTKEKKKQSLKTAPEEAQMLDLLDKNFKLSILNKFEN